MQLVDLEKLNHASVWCNEILQVFIAKSNSCLYNIFR
jgi:hypothetical protein